MDEALHFCWVSKSEGRVGLQSDENIVGVDVGGAELNKARR